MEYSCSVLLWNSTLQGSRTCIPFITVRNKNIDVPIRELELRNRIYEIMWKLVNVIIFILIPIFLLVFIFFFLPFPHPPPFSSSSSSHILLSVTSHKHLPHVTHQSWTLPICYFPPSQNSPFSAPSHHLPSQLTVTKPYEVQCCFSIIFSFPRDAPPARTLYLPAPRFSSAVTRKVCSSRTVFREECFARTNVETLFSTAILFFLLYNTSFRVNILSHKKCLSVDYRSSFSKLQWNLDYLYCFTSSLYNG